MVEDLLGGALEMAAAPAAAPVAEPPAEATEWTCPMHPEIRRAGPGACPICGKPSQRATYPFCSKRCADIDLNRWLKGAYSIPGKTEPDEDENGGPA